MEYQKSTSWSSFLSNFSIAPIDLKAFLVFCFIIPISGLVVQFAFPKEITDTIIPVTGWNMGLLYGFNLIITVGPMRNPNGRKGVLTMQYGNCLLLAIMLLFGVTDLVTYNGGYEGNPYLSHSPLRWIWTIATPTFWMLIILSPRIKNYFQSLTLKEPIAP